MPWLSTPQPYFLQNFCASSPIHCLIFSLLLAIAAAEALAAADEDADKVLVIKGTLVDEVEEGEALVGGGRHSGVLCDEERPQCDGCNEARKDVLGVAALDLLSFAGNVEIQNE